MERILIIHNYYQQPGGERTAVRAQISLLQQQGHDVLLYTEDNAEIKDYGLPQKALAIGRTIFSSKAYHQIQELVEQKRPAVAHIHNVFPLISPAIYHGLRQTGIPIVQTIHNFRFLCPNSFFFTQGQICERCKYGNTLNAIRYRCYRESYFASALYALSIGGHRKRGTFQQIDRFIALTEFAAQKLVESQFTTRDKIAILGNFLPEPLPPPGFFDDHEPYVIFMGRLSAEKGVDTLIKAMAGVPNLKLKVLGVGPEAERLQALGQQLQGRVEFLGFVAGEKKWELLRRALAVVVPSVWYEHFPLTILESFAAATPVLASKLGSLPHIIREGETGLFTQPNDVKDMQSKLRFLAANPQKSLKMGQAARAEVEARFVASVHYERLMQIYDEVQLVSKGSAR
ncbi:MAG: glycosyltransferase family 4 protein [Ardenticatenaceae bacterium]